MKTRYTKWIRSISVFFSRNDNNGDTLQFKLQIAYWWWIRIDHFESKLHWCALFKIIGIQGKIKWFVIVNDCRHVDVCLWWTAYNAQPNQRLLNEPLLVQAYNFKRKTILKWEKMCGTFKIYAEIAYCTLVSLCKGRENGATAVMFDLLKAN